MEATKAAIICTCLGQTPFTVQEYKTTVFVITTVLGLIANGLVIWIAGFKIKKTVNTV
ncbi:C3a anaphylatoxin chemotactic receptor, partial [Clarias magur]